MTVGAGAPADSKLHIPLQCIPRLSVARGPPARFAVRNYLTGIVGHTPRTFRNRKAGRRPARHRQLGDALGWVANDAANPAA